MKHKKEKGATAIPSTGEAPRWDLNTSSSPIGYVLFHIRLEISIQSSLVELSLH